MLRLEILAYFRKSCNKSSRSSIERSTAPLFDMPEVRIRVWPSRSKLMVTTEAGGRSLRQVRLMPMGESGVAVRCSCGGSWPVLLALLPPLPPAPLLLPPPPPVPPPPPPPPPPARLAFSAALVSGVSCNGSGLVIPFNLGVVHASAG